MLLSYTIDLLSAIYLICFGLGLVMSIGSLMLGGHSHDLSGSSAGGAHAHVHALHDIQHFDHTGSSQLENRVPFISMNTVLAFLLGFGAAGYSVQHLLINPTLILSLGIAIIVGLAFASLIYFFLNKILIRGQSAYLKECDFDLRGVEGVVSSSIFSHGLGEVSYIFNQSRQALPAKDKQDRGLSKGTRIIILAVHQGVATVLPLEEFKQHIAQKEE